METIFGDENRKKLADKGIIAVIVIEDPTDAAPLARALVNGGVTAMELTLRTPVAMEALKTIIKEVPEMKAGVGTILTLEQVRAVKSVKADFGVSPGFNRRVVEEAIKIGLPFAPGISTASEIEASVELGCRVLKFFPAENMGGLKYLEAVNNPYGFLNLKYIPLGGLNMQNLSSWLEKPYILAVGGSWIAPKSLIAQKAWETITDNAARAMAIFHNVRG